MGRFSKKIRGGTSSSLCSLKIHNELLVNFNESCIRFLFLIVKESTTLYIIGNGFDLHHEIKSKYSDFAAYLKSVDPGIHEEIDTYFSFDGFWNNFEENLANFDVDMAIDNASGSLISYGDENWSDSYHHAYQYELNRIVESVSSKLQERFSDWVMQIQIPSMVSCDSKLLPLDLNARYLNFNYTPTLQQVYGIPNDEILHIHGNRNIRSDQLFLGHGWKRKEQDSLNYRIDIAEEDIRIIEGNDIVDSYFSKTFKPVADILLQNQSFFTDLKPIKQIYVLGHSLAEVDSPYFNAIISNIDKTSTRWAISFHGGAEELEGMQSGFAKFDINMDLAHFSALGEIHG
jgi:Bacteriophage abortive infection AbiH